MNTKTTLTLLLLFVPILAPAGSYSSEPLSGSDIAQILDLSASKYTVDFSESKELVLRYANGPTRQVIPIGTASRIDVVLYSPSKDGGESSIGIIIKKYQKDSDVTSGFSTYFPGPQWDSSKGRLTRTNFEGDIFTSEGAQTEDFLEPVYSITIMSKELAEQGAAANP